MALLTDKVTIVNGASRGIGAAAARLFSAEGAKLVLAGRRRAGAGPGDARDRRRRARLHLQRRRPAGRRQPRRYQTGKHALVGLVKALTFDYAADGIRANAIAPGSTRTEMIEDWARHAPGLIERLAQGNPTRRMADPSEAAEAAAWLLSDRASYVTGVTLPVDGGLVAAPA